MWNITSLGSSMPRPWSTQWPLYWIHGCHTNKLIYLSIYLHYDYPAATLYTASTPSPFNRWFPCEPQGWKISQHFQKNRKYRIFWIYIRYFWHLCLRIKICINCDTISCCCMVILLTLQINVISLEYILIRFQILTKHSEWVSIIVNIVYLTLTSN